MTADHIQSTPVAGLVGAELHGVDLAAELDAPTIERIWDELTRHKVVFFRGQSLDEAAHVAFARRLGPLTTAHPTVPGVRSHANVLDVNAANGGRANSWHTDVTFVDRPPAASVLRAVELPPTGGDTVWANTAVAYSTLPDAVRELVDGLWAVHTNAFDYAVARARTMTARQQRYAEVFSATAFETRHPVVHVHPRSGERALLLGNFARQILGVGVTLSNSLLRDLQDHITRLEHTVRWRWQPGDVAIWDNLATQHYAIADYGSAPRSMNRVTIAGDLPVAVDGRRSEALAGDSSTYTAA